MEDNLLDFVEERASNSIIMVIGVGGGGSNAVNHMYNLDKKTGIEDVRYMVCNTDSQALDNSPVQLKVRLGNAGLGAGNNPEKGREAAEMSLQQIIDHIDSHGIEMVFVTAGMGGGTGTGAAPVIAKALKDRGILTVGIVTMPLRAEGRKRITQAAKGLEEMKNSVDSLLIINNENIREEYGDLAYTEAFGKADDILATAARSISGIVSQHSYINSDMEDVKSIMRNSGVSLMCMAECETGKSLIDAMKEALNSPLLNHNDIRGAQNILAHVRCGKEEISLNELCSIMDDLQVMTTGGEFDNEEGNLGADLIWGAGMDNTLGDKNCVTIIATHFKTEVDVKSDVKKNEKRSQATTPKVEKEVIEQQGAISTNNPKLPIIEINYDYWEETPAYIRRRMVFENTRGESVRAEKTEHSSNHGAGNVSMFNLD